MSNNVFTDCEKKLTENDILLVENDLSVKFPSDFKEHYLKFNGGTPKNTIWVDPEHKWDDNEVGDFLPLRFRKSKGDDPDFTIDGIAREEWREKKLPSSLIPFAVDWGGNYFCIDHVTGKVFFFVRDVWSDNLSVEKNLEINTIYVTDSLTTFIENLKFNDDD